MKVITLPLSVGPVLGAQRPAQRRSHRTAKFTAARKPTACTYFSAFRMRFNRSAVVSKAYVRRCRESRGIETWSLVFCSAASECVCVKRLGVAGHLSPAVLGTLLSAVTRWTLSRYVPRLCVLSCCCVLAAPTYWLCCAFVAVENRHQHPLPLLGLGSKCASLPYMAKKAAATLFMVTRWRQYQYRPLLLGASCRWIVLISCSPPICHLDSSDIKNNTSYKITIWGNSAQVTTSYRVRTIYNKTIAIVI